MPSVSEDQILMSVGKPEALAHAELHAMRQVADAIKIQGQQTIEHMAASTRAMERLSEKVEGMNARLIRLEEQKHGREIEKLTDEVRGALRRIDGLESTRDQQRGAKGFVEWMSKNTPWLIAAAAFIAAAIGVKQP
jgi:hypothetical protein